MIQSMTAYASRTGALDGASWIWEMRGVNARGLDVKLRLPDGLDGVEQAVRAAIKENLTRGNITVSLRLSKDDAGSALAVDEVQLDRVLQALEQVQDRAFSLGVTLGQPTAADVLSQRGVVVQNKSEEDDSTLVDALKTELPELMKDFVAMRSAEGDALQHVLISQVDEIESLTASAIQAAEARKSHQAASLKDAFGRVMAEAKEVDPTRVEQELAVIAVKQDVTEELDRLTAHIAAARDMIADPKPMGRKLDFLAQEFNREANTLCSKAQFKDLTSVGLDLKAVIDQMREQIQNVE